MADLHVVILAAGKGTRMKSERPKVLHRVAGRPLIDYVLRAAAPLEAASTTVIVGHMAETVRQALTSWPDLSFVVQEPQRGTGHALMQVAPSFLGRTGTLVLLSGDVPLLETATLRRLVRAHLSTRAAATVLTAVVDRPLGYGRLVRSDDRAARIVEERDASEEERTIREINSGIYAYDIEPLFEAVHRLEPQNAQGEYYATDLVEIFARLHRRVEIVIAHRPDEIRGINSRKELADVNALVRRRKVDELMAAGVTIEDPSSTYIDADVTVGADTVIHPGVHVSGRTTIGRGSEIHPNVRIADSRLGDGVLVQSFCVIDRAEIADGARIGPFAHLRPGAVVGRNARVGNFVELKNTLLGAGSKANHLSYLGDATIGAGVNIGAGTITCNYDGERKHATVIEDGAFIGSDSQLIAPVRIGRGAYIAAGSSITEDVPPDALGIARGRQVNVKGWVARRKRPKKKPATRTPARVRKAGKR